MGGDGLIVSVLLLWGLWGILIAWFWRWLLPRFVFRFEKKWIALLCTYVSIAAMVAFSVWFLEFSEWSIKGPNEEPLQQAGAIVFFLSPIGYPLIWGGPIVLIADIFLFLKRKYWEPMP